jgi:hypothetical protein
VELVVGIALPFAAFVVIYGLLQERARRKTGARPPVPWGWLAAIAACVAVALLAGLVL